MRFWPGLVFFVLVCLAVGLLGSIGTNLGMADGWYMRLEKPVWQPPDWVFGPVWTVLYVLMGISLWLVFRNEGPDRVKGIVFFFTQLFFNLLWSWLFFAWHQIGWAFFEVVLLWFLIVVTIIFFRRINKAAGWLLVPYLAWVSFAVALNFAIWNLNPG